MGYILEYILILSALGMALSYLYMINIIRAKNNKSTETYDNLFVVNFIKVYIRYLNVDQSGKTKRKLILCFHLLLLLVTLVLGYFFGEFQ